MSFEMPRYKAPDFGLDIFRNAPDAAMAPAERDGIVPEGYHSTSMFPEYFKINGRWLLAGESRMDSCVVYRPESNRLDVVEARNIKKGDLVLLGRTESGRDGIFVHANGFAGGEDALEDAFVFRQGRSRETSYSRDYDQLTELLKYEKQHGKVVWVMGPTFAFDRDARRAMQAIVENGYVHGLMAGNALATHDLEGGYLRTALGCDIINQKQHFMGHYNHLDTINAINTYGSIPAFIEKENIQDGIIYNCVKNNVPFVLNGSIRDDGPLPEVLENNYVGQDTIRSHIRKATTVIGMATVLHTIASGNMTPTYRVLGDGTIRPVYFYMVDTSEFAANKLGDRGSLAAKGIVTNVQDFMRNLSTGLGL